MALDSSIDSGAHSGGSGGGGDGEISLSMPRRSAHDTYLIDATMTLQKFNQIIFSMNGPTDPRVVPYTRQCINLVLDDNIRKAMKIALREALEYIDSLDEDVDMATRGSLQIESCQEALGEVRSYLDEFIGLAKRNAMVPISSDPTEAEVAAVTDILNAGGDIEVGGEEMTDPGHAMADPETVVQSIVEAEKK